MKIIVMMQIALLIFAAPLLSSSKDSKNLYASYLSKKINESVVKVDLPDGTIMRSHRCLGFIEIVAPDGTEETIFVDKRKYPRHLYTKKLPDGSQETIYRDNL